jgi:hypothetical protein
MVVTAADIAAPVPVEERAQQHGGGRVSAQELAVTAS